MFLTIFENFLGKFFWNSVGSFHMTIYMKGGFLTEFASTVGGDHALSSLND